MRSRRTTSMIVILRGTKEQAEAALDARAMSGLYGATFTHANGDARSWFTLAAESEWTVNAWKRGQPKDRGDVGYLCAAWPTQEMVDDDAAAELFVVHEGRPEPIEEGAVLVPGIYGHQDPARVLRCLPAGTIDVERLTDGKCFRITGIGT